MAEDALERRGLVLGTAGHIDHGKTLLISRLTGTNTDRLPEEHRRGISIELGFAELRLPGGGSLGVIDVPGHEGLVRTMVAGAAAIDLFLLVIAADDGVMPQTAEHLEVLRALGVNRGVVAVTKVDRASPDIRSLRCAQAGELVPDAPVVEVSAQTGEGLNALVTTLEACVQEVGRGGRGRGTEPWPPEDPVLHVDRSFTVAGAGTVVTGTLATGALRQGEKVLVLPEGSKARIRRIEVHGRELVSVGSGSRVALNLAGVSTGETPRGSTVITDGNGPRGSWRLDVRLLGELEDTARQLPRRVQVHHGTTDVPARLVEFGGGLAQLRLDGRLIAAARDRLVLRGISPSGTLGGAEVLDPNPRRHGTGPEVASLHLLLNAGPREILEAALAQHPSGIPAEPTNWRQLGAIAYALPRHSEQQWRQALAALGAEGRIECEGRWVRAASSDKNGAPTPSAPPPPDSLIRRVGEILRADGLEPRAPQAVAEKLGVTRVEVEGALAALVEAGAVSRAGRDVFYDSAELRRLEERAGELARRHGSITIAELRDAWNTSRKYSQAILEHLDAAGITVRRGDRHLPRGPGASA